MDPQLLTSHQGPRASIYAPLIQSQPQRPSASTASYGAASSSTSSNPVPLTGALARLTAKQAELDGLRALREQSAEFAQNLEALSERLDELVVGGDAVANVMASWQGVFRAIMVAQSAIASSKAEVLAAANNNTNNAAGSSTGPEGAPRIAGSSDADQIAGTGTSSGVDPNLVGPSVPGTLVRIPVDLDVQQDLGEGDDSTNQ
ncbi:DASH complex subunit dad2 [Tilletia horrida]|uniref:DASH complex subunit DAD2 n=1 Tax=Tilletia horrida TaxID=155126 RepID=A0AAN6GN25_9BASI|nr:DASH complex subunit dad2 [Tilletia horrida]